MNSLSAKLGRRRSHLLEQALLHFVLAAGALLMLFPLYWMISTAFKPMTQYYDWPPRWIPNPPSLEAFQQVLAMYPWPRFGVNTLTITAAAMLGSLLSCSVVAYGFSYFRAPGRDLLFIILLSQMMLPGVVTMVPTFILFRKLGWIDTYLPLTVPSYFASPLYVFLLRQFFRTLPPELPDAAKIDGCGEFSILWRIVLPLCGPVLTAIAIFQFQAHWNDFMAPLIYLNTWKKYTLALALNTLRGEPQGSTPTQIMAGGTLMTLPVILVFAIFQRYFIRGVVLSGIKG